LSTKRGHPTSLRCPIRATTPDLAHVG
jgi:hypothetical protein